MDSEQLGPVRFNWNTLPSTRLEHSRLAVPIGCEYQPFKIQHPVTSNIPLQCHQCGNYFNPFSKVDRGTRVWWCSFCCSNNVLGDGEVPELNGPVSSSVEYILPHDISRPVRNHVDFRLFVLDVLVLALEDKDELNACIDSIISDMLTPGVMVGLITFDDHIAIHNLSRKSVGVVDLNIIDSSKPFSAKAWSNVSQSIEEYSSQDAFVTVTESNRYDIAEYIKSVSLTVCMNDAECRVTGQALYVSSVLLAEFLPKGSHARLELFTRGPCTYSLGQVVDRGCAMRSHSNLAEATALHYFSACQFYQTLAYIANGLPPTAAHAIASSASKKTHGYDILSASTNWLVNVYAGCLDQPGLCELRNLASTTMGRIYLNDTFRSPYFQELFAAKSHKQVAATLATLTIVTTPNIKVSRLVGAYGYALPSSFNQASKHYHRHQEAIADTVTAFDSVYGKQIFTNKWHFTELRSSDSLLFTFEMKTAKREKDIDMTQLSNAVIQFQIRYNDPACADTRLMLTTVSKPTTIGLAAANYVRPALLSSLSCRVFREHALVRGFDQACWLLILTKLLIHKAESCLGHQPLELLAGLVDETVATLLRNFSGIAIDAYSKLDPNPLVETRRKYSVNSGFDKVPRFALNLRKSPQVVSVFNCSPDETAYYLHWLARLPLDQCLISISPRLYSKQGEWNEIDADSLCLARPPRTVLVMDTLFQVIIFHVWTELDSQRLELHPSENLALIQSRHYLAKDALDYIALLNCDRPLPIQYVLTGTGHSQARLLTSRLNAATAPSPRERGNETDSLKKITSMLKGLFSSLKSSSRNTLNDLMSLDQYLSWLYQQL